MVHRGPCGGFEADPVGACSSVLPFTFLQIIIIKSENVEGFWKCFLTFLNKEGISVVISFIFFTPSHLVHYSVKM